MTKPDKGQAKTREKVELFIVSLWPLFLLIIVITVDIPICFGDHCKFIGIVPIIERNSVPITSVILLALGLIFLSRFKYKLEGSSNIPLTISNVENVNYEHLTFLTTYIIPLICFDLSQTRYILVMAVLLVIIGMVYIKTNIFYANPSLALLGYHIYKVDGDFRGQDKSGVILISKEKLSTSDKVFYMKLDQKIFYARKSQ